MDINGGKPQIVGPTDFVDSSVPNDGKRIAGYNFPGQTVVLDLATQKVRPVPGIGSQEGVDRRTEDGHALQVLSWTPWWPKWIEWKWRAESEPHFRK